MNGTLSTIIVSAVLVLIFALVILKIVKNKKSGKSACGCGCADCPSRNNCKR